MTFQATWSLANTPIVVFITVIFFYFFYFYFIFYFFLFFFPLYLVVVYYANSVFVFFLFKGSSKCGFSTLLSCSGFIVCSFCIMYFYLNK